MMGTRNWISKVDKILSSSDSPNLKNSLNHQYYQTLLIQGKKISQIIAFIWLNEDPECKFVVKQLDQYFKQDNEHRSLKKLLFAKKGVRETATEYDLLKEIFEEEHLPIFSDEDEPYIEFDVATDRFEGSLSDPGPSDNAVIRIIIPYPPRPEIIDDIGPSGSTIGYSTIKRSELKEWLNQSPEDSPFFYENNPYIPASSS